MTDQERAHRHAQRRAWRRFGLAVGEPELREAEQDIWAGRAEWIADLKPMRQAYWVALKGRRVVAVFDIHIEAIVTVLPNVAMLRLRGRNAA